MTDTIVTDTTTTEAVIPDASTPTIPVIDELSYEARLNEGEWLPIYQQFFDYDGVRICFKNKTVDELKLLLKDLNNISLTVKELPTGIVIRTELNLYPENITLELSTGSAMVKFKKLSQEAIAAIELKETTEKTQSNVEYLAMMMEVEL